MSRQQHPFSLLLHYQNTLHGCLHGLRVVSVKMACGMYQEFDAIVIPLVSLWLDGLHTTHLGFFPGNWGLQPGC